MALGRFNVVSQCHFSHLVCYIICVPFLNSLLLYVYFWHVSSFPSPVWCSGSLCGCSDISSPFIDVIITSLINHLLPLISSFTFFDISFYSVDSLFTLCDLSTLCDLLLGLLVVLTPLRHTHTSSSLTHFFHSRILSLNDFRHNKVVIKHLYKI